MTVPAAGIAVARAPSAQCSPKISLLCRIVHCRSTAVSLRWRLPRFLGTGLTVAFYTLTLLIGLSEGGHLEDFRRDHGEFHHVLARIVGLGLEQVTISGIGQLQETEVLAAANLTSKVSLPFLDVEEMKKRLERVPLIKSAAVRKLYPNEVVISLVERKPYALWQLKGELFVIAEDGTVVDLLQDERFVDLPFVVGEGANLRMKEYLALLDVAGPIRSRIRAGTLVAGRRWTLKMDNGLDVRLPEIGAAEAVARLVKLDREQKILEKDVLAIDLRMAGRIVVRLTEGAFAARAETMGKKPLRGKGVDT